MLLLPRCALTLWYSPQLESSTRHAHQGPELVSTPIALVAKGKNNRPLWTCHQWVNFPGESNNSKSQSISLLCQQTKKYKSHLSLRIVSFNGSEKEENDEIRYIKRLSTRTRVAVQSSNPRAAKGKPFGKLENKLTEKRSKLPQSLASFKSAAVRNYWHRLTALINTWTSNHIHWLPAFLCYPGILILLYTNFITHSTFSCYSKFAKHWIVHQKWLHFIIS